MELSNAGKIKDTVAVILAGGNSRRMGQDKMMLKLGDASVLQSIINRFSVGFEKILVSVANPEKYPDLTEEIVIDSYKNVGPLAGLHASLTKINSSPDIRGIFLVAADLPYVTPEDAKKVIERSEGFDICVPIDDDGRFEPLFAYYSKEILSKLEDFLDTGQKKVINFYPNVELNTIKTSEFHSKHFFNLNYPEDYNMVINSGNKKGS